jgi:hypothetical protein
MILAPINFDVAQPHVLRRFTVGSDPFRNARQSHVTIVIVKSNKLP